jgi:acetoin utilization protein AcuB
MLVRDRMSKNPITTYPNASVPDALQVMRGSKVRQLPVLTDKGELVGIVSLDDLLRVSPSPATSLSIYELNYLFEKIKVEVTENMALEEAGRVMADNKISGVPVTRDGELIGILTESHLFNVLIELFGAREPGVRVVFTFPEVKGTLAKITGAISGQGGKIVAIGETSGPPGARTVTMKVQDVEREAVLEAIRPFALDIEDVRES